MGSIHGRIGEVSEVRRTVGELCVHWKIPRFLDLTDASHDGIEFKSPRFRFSDARWHLRAVPRYWCSSHSLYLDLCKDRDAGPSDRTVIVSWGVRVSGGGVENRTEKEGEVGEDVLGLSLGYICERSELTEQKERFLQGDALTIVFEMKLTGTAARGVLSHPSLSDSEIRQPVAPDNRGQSSDNTGVLSHSPLSDSAMREPVTPENGSQYSDNRGVLSHPPPSDSAMREPVTPDNKSQSSDKRGEFTSGVLITYSYKELQTVTQNFADLPLHAGGCKIGEGGFGTVYRAVIRDHVIAVKRLKGPVDEQFVAELMTLTNYKHENLLPLIGFSLCSSDGHQCCLLYEYMPNGSLQDRLACADGSEPLSCQTRLSISYGTALGINHLHTFGEKPMVHRDIKSANILLDQNFVPKVGDFGLVRTGSRGVRSSTKVSTENNSGTSVYMPREAFMGDVSVKWDAFSFGVILLELLTGLPPLDPKREDKDLVTHMELCEDISPRLDPRADWNRESATELYGIARKRCLVQSRRERSTISEILEDLRILSSER